MLSSTAFGLLMFILGAALIHCIHVAAQHEEPDWESCRLLWSQVAGEELWIGTLGGQKVASVWIESKRWHVTVMECFGVTPVEVPILGKASLKDVILLAEESSPVLEAALRAA